MRNPDRIGPVDVESLTGGASEPFFKNEERTLTLPPTAAGATKTGVIEIVVDATPVQAQIDELLALLDRLPQSVRDAFANRLCELREFGLVTEDMPASSAGKLVLGLRSVVLAEFRAAALRALDGDLAELDIGHGGPYAN